MKKLLLTLAAAIATCTIAHSQVVNMANAELNKQQRPAFTMQVDYSKKLVVEAVEKRFKNDKLKGKVSGGVTCYAKATYSAMCVTNCDIYTIIDGNGKSATVNIFVARENGNYITSGDDEEQCIKKFMLSLYADVQALDLHYQIEEQTKVYEKAVKDHEKLLDKKADLEKELKNVEKDIQNADKEKALQKDVLEQLKKKQQ